MLQVTPPISHFVVGGSELNYHSKNIKNYVIVLTYLTYESQLCSICLCYKLLLQFHTLGLVGVN